MAAIVATGPYGAVEASETGCRVRASADQTRAWAGRAGARWPCSTLAGHRVRADYDPRGLVDLDIGRDIAYRLTATELAAWSADVTAGLPAALRARWAAIIDRG